jgi:hypothetical protein
VSCDCNLLLERQDLALDCSFFGLHRPFLVVLAGQGMLIRP